MNVRPVIHAALALVACVTSFLSTHLASAQTTPTFEPADCAIILKPAIDNPVLTSLVPADANIDCGYIVVPEEHAKDNGKTIKLAVAVLRATDADGKRLNETIKKGDPLIMLQGGPGGSTIDTYGIAMRNSKLRRHRDIVLFDQRGTGKSLPGLFCPEIYQLSIETAEVQLDYDAGMNRYDAAVATCRERMIKEGINLNAFDSLENAADVDAVRAALGYDRINLYGVSYGTLLALHVMRNFPAIVRSAVIDSVVPTQNNFVIEATRSENRALTELFNACAADTACNRDYPNLEKTFYDLVERLDKTPARVTVADPNTGRTYRIPVDGETLQAFVFQSLYPSGLIPLLPRMIYETYDGRTGTLGNVAGLFLFTKSIANGMYYSVLCAEDSDYDPKLAAWPELRPQIAKNAVKDAESQKRICAAFNVEQLPAAVDDPVVSDIPTLVLNGRFDPITPPANGAQAAETLANSYSFVFPNTGHGAYQAVECATNIADAFIDSPTVKPDDSCIGGLTPPKFVRRDQMIYLPVAGQLMMMLQNAPQQNRVVELWVILIALLVLLTGFLLLPLGWLARLIFNKNHPRLKPPLLANLMSWLSILVTVFVFVALAAMLQSAFTFAAANQLEFLAGVSSDIRLFFVLPILAVVFTALIVLGVIGGWRSGAWGLGRKLYRGMLALAAVAACIILGLWGMIAAPLFG